MDDPNRFLDPEPGAVTDPSMGPTLARDPLVGTQLGDYLVQEKIGAGGMGIVYGGVHPVIGKRVAIKVLQWEAARNPEEAARLKAEARLVNSIGHRGIVDIYDFGTTPDGRDYVVMELLSGEPLDRVIASRAPLPIPEVLGMLEEVCDALSAAHGAGVIHRDLKPNNVFQVVPAHGTRYVKLLDFGLAKKSASPHGSSAQTRVSMVVGTPYYMAPEQARGQPVSPQTDLYSLGVMAFEMCTAKLPFDAATPFEVISMHINKPAPSMMIHESGVPPALDDLVLRLLAKTPSDRPASAEAVRRELLRIKNRLQTDATHIGGAPSRDSGKPTQTEMEAVEPSTNPAPPEPMHTQAYGQPPKREAPVRLSSQPQAPIPMPATPAASPAPPRPSRPPSPVAKSNPPRAAAKWSSLQTPRPKKRMPGWLVGVLAAIVTLTVGGGLFLALFPDAHPFFKRPAAPADPQPTPEPVDPEPPQLDPPPPIPDVKPADVKPPEPPTPEEPKPLDPKPAEPKTVDPKAGDPKPDPKPEPDGRPVKLHPVRPKPSAAVQAAKEKLLDRVDSVARKVEETDDKLEATRLKALRDQVMGCRTAKQIEEAEESVRNFEKHYR